MNFGLTVLLYALAFPPLVVIYQSRWPLFLGALGAGLVGAALSMALLLLARAPLRRAALYSLVVGLVVAELALAVSFWTVVGLVGGALLWLAFYALSGLSLAHSEGVLDRRVALEYVVVFTAGLAIILSSAPWHS